MKKLLCLSALIVYAFACCPSSATRSPTPIVEPLPVQPSPVPPEPTDTSVPLPTETPIPTDTPQPLPTEVPPTETPIPEKPIVTATEGNVNLRNGPSTDYETIGTLSSGESLEVVGRNADSSWWQVSAPTGLAWVAASVVTASNIDDSIPVVEAPPPPVQPTDTPAPPAPPPGEAQVVIVAVNKEDEYVDIQNIGGAPQDLTGWLLFSERGPQDCPLGGVIQPGETLRIWAMSEDKDKGGYNCGHDGPIWRNDKSDPAVLYDATGQEVDRK